jgi:REP element-mobilizing transposase RayT
MEPIKEGNYYHIFNRGAGRRNIFRVQQDFTEFIQKYYYYLQPSVQTFSWCLLSNHFHAVIRVRTKDEQASFYEEKSSRFKVGTFHGSLDPKIKPYIASRQLSHLMNSYTRYFNKKYDNSGTLIEGPLKRKRIVDQSNFIHLVCYCHRNPIHHGICKTYTQYKQCSYVDYVTDKKTFVEREFVLRGFGGKMNFVQAHEEFRLKIDAENDFYLE